MITEKQRRAIKYIECNLKREEVQFTGSTFKEAKTFISTYIDQSKDARSSQFKDVDSFDSGSHGDQKSNWTNAFWNHRPY